MSGTSLDFLDGILKPFGGIANRQPKPTYQAKYLSIWTGILLKRGRQEMSKETGYRLLVGL
jgi:hypothetical protein